MGDVAGARHTKQARSAERQEAMRRAAAELLIGEGPDAVTHRRVAVAAGLPTGSASYYFPSKEALYAAAVSAAEDLRAEAARSAADALPRRARGATRTAHLLIETFYAPGLHPDVVHLRLEPMLHAARTPGLAEVMRSSRPRLLDSLRTVLRRSGYAPVADGPDIDLLATTIDAGLLYASSSGSTDPVETTAELVARLLELAADDRSRDAGRG